ncbi:MAG: hypothetical protein FJX44_07735 [Alphaproteobacteria bacterium]|nr:hypothetical protein [Alphaproteobacteria bacterium]
MIKVYALTGLMLAALASPALAKSPYFAVIDTVGNCSVIKGAISHGKTALGTESGYDSFDAARQVVDDHAEEKCEGIVE